MKKTRVMRYAMAAFIAFAIVALLPGQAFAKTVKAYTHKSTVKIATVMKKATAIKTGTQTVKIPKTKRDAYIKFKAPKTKTYTFTFSNLKSGSEHGTVLVAGFEQLSRIRQKLVSVKTDESGKRSYLPLFDTAFCDAWEGGEKESFTYASKKYNVLTKRTAKIKLKKGQTIYLAMGSVSFPDLDNVACSFKLKIK